MDSPCDTDERDSKPNGNSLFAGVSNGEICENAMIEPGILTEMLTRLEMGLGYSSEKLGNLDLYMMILSLGENGLEELSLQKDNISEVEIEKALMFDLLICYLDSEVTDLRHFLNVLRVHVVDANKIYSSRQRRDIFDDFQVKLHGSESSWKQLQEKLSDMKQQLAILHKTLPISAPESTLEDESLEISGFDLKTVGQRRHVLRMLEKSLGAELDFEKQLLESKEREEELKLKLFLTNETVSDMEAFTEVTLERLLEAEHSSEIYKGIAKEMMSRLQTLQFNLHCSVQREGKLESKLQSTLEQLKVKEKALVELESNYAKVNEKLQDSETLEGKIKLLQEKLQSSESKLQEASASCEASQAQLSLMQNAVETFREHAFRAERRAQDAETKLTSLTEENMELREEVGFLKVGDSNVEKISLLEKQVRDLEAQVQTARITSEASTEQQNMLYSAIWDMETLIEELKSKISKSESRAENAEEQCLVLAEANLGLNKEIGVLTSKCEKLEASLTEANSAIVVRIKDINNGAKLVTEMVVQLAVERERIQKQSKLFGGTVMQPDILLSQLSSLARENKILLEELRKMRNIAKAKQDNVEGDAKQVGVDPPTDISREVSVTEELGETPASATASNQVEEPSEQNLTDEAEAAGSSTSDDATAAVNVSENEIEGKEKSKHLNKKSYIFGALFVLVLSALAMNFNWQYIYPVLRHVNLGFQ